MEEKMVHRLPIPLAHTTPINHNDMSLPEIVQTSKKITKRKKKFSKPRECRDSNLSRRESTFSTKGSGEGIHILLGI
jgi:hypothetical protein